MSASERAGDVRVARRKLDDALLGLRAIQDPEVLVRDAKLALADGMEALYRAELHRASWPDFHDDVQTAMRCVRETLEILQETVTDDLAVAVCLEYCASALGDLLSARPPPADDPLPVPRATGMLLAMENEPTLVQLPRTVLRPEVPIAPAMPAESPADEVATTEAWTDIDALLALAEASVAGVDGEDDDEEPASVSRSSDSDLPPAEVPDAHAAVFGTPSTEDELLRWRAGVLLIDLASLGRMRFPQRDLPWAHGEESERRLLTRLDAIYVCGAPVLSHLVTELDDRPVPDPELAWALVLLHGCIDGRDAIDELARILEVLELSDAEVAGAVANALMLAPNMMVGPLIRPWLQDRRIERRRIAAHVLAQRRELTLAGVAELCGDSDREIAMQGALGLLLFEGAVPAEAFRVSVNHESEGVSRAGIIAALAHRRTIGLRKCLDLCAAGSFAQCDAAMFLAVAASREEAEKPLLDAAERDDLAAVRALGWFGSVPAIELLLTKVGSELDGIPVAAAISLERITGAFLLDEGEIVEIPGEEPFRRAWSEPIVPPEPCLDPKRWNLWWRIHRGHARHELRYRGGHVWSPKDDLFVLSDAASTLDERVFAWIELVVRTGGNLPLDWHRFVSHQRMLIERWRAHVQRQSGKIQEGSWPVRYLEG